MKVSFEDARELYTKYTDADLSMADYYVEFPEDVNVLDPLFLLERINEKPTFSRKAELVTALITNKKVVLWLQPAPKKNEAGEVVETFEAEKVHGFTFNGQGTLGALFSEKPYLLQIVVDYGYALILKKLTPPSTSSKEVTAGE